MTSEATTDNDTQPGRLERRKARTRAAILDSASRLFHERGYEETSIQQIAEAADTGVGTVYGYFSSKEDVLREVVRLHAVEAVQRYRASIDRHSPATDRMVAALDSFAHYLRDGRAILIAAFQAAARHRRVDEQSSDWLLEAYRGILSEGISRGQVPQLPVDSTARLLIGTYTMAMLGIGVWRGHEDDPQTLADLQKLTRALLSP